MEAHNDSISNFRSNLKTTKDLKSFVKRRTILSSSGGAIFGAVIATVVSFTGTNQSAKSQAESYQPIIEEFNEIKPLYGNNVAQFESDFYDALIVENFLVRKDVENLPALTYEMAYESLSQFDEFNEMDSETSCKAATRKMMRYLCKNQTKYVKKMARKNQLGAMKVNQNQEITIVGPSFATFKDQENRLNALIALLNDHNKKLCQSSYYCMTLNERYFCGEGLEPRMEEVFFDQCIPILTNAHSTFENTLVTIDNVLEKFKNGEMSDAQVKAVMNAELDKLSGAFNSSETSDEEPEGDSSNETDSGIDTTSSSGIDTTSNTQVDTTRSIGT
jgi:hypothetical protein